MNITLNTECRSCAGTGLYQGFMEAKHQAVICVNCGGTGCKKIEVTKFIGRKRREGVTQIRGGSGTIMDDSRSAKWVSYREFEEKIPAPRTE